MVRDQPDEICLSFPRWHKPRGKWSGNRRFIQMVGSFSPLHTERLKRSTCNFVGTTQFSREAFRKISLPCDLRPKFPDFWLNGKHLQKTKSCFVKVLNLIGRVDGMSFLDQSQSHPHPPVKCCETRITKGKLQSYVFDELWQPWRFCLKTKEMLLWLFTGYTNLLSSLPGKPLESAHLRRQPSKQQSPPGR